MINIKDQKRDYYYESDRPELVPFIPKESKKVLDVGCGMGHFAKHIKDQNKAEVWGLEYDPSSAEKAASLLDKVLTGDVITLSSELPENHFDLICFNDVLEHLLDPYQALEKMRTKLNGDGIVFASIPHIRYFKAMIELVMKKDLLYTDHGTFDRTHLRFFSKKSIIRMFEEAGYEIIQIKGINASKSIRPFLIKVLTLWKLDDCEFLQYAVTAKSKNN